MICPCGNVIDETRIHGPVKCACGRWHNWPTWAKAVARWRVDGDVGVGDTFHRLAIRVGAENIIRWFGIDCGCEGRRDKWNKMYRYDISRIMG